MISERAEQQCYKLLPKILWNSLNINKTGKINRWKQGKQPRIEEERGRHKRLRKTKEADIGESDSDEHSLRVNQKKSPPWQ